ncbi:MAG: extracellular solute-binding protein [Anaerolineae bacterium]
MATQSRGVSRRTLLKGLAGAAALLSVSTACTPAAITVPAKTAVPAATTEVVAPTAAPAGPQKLVYWHGGGAPEHIEVTKQQIDLYTAKHPEVTIETVPGANNVKLIAALASGAPPDVAWPWGTPASGSWAANGLLTELDPLIEKTGFDKDNILPALLDCNMLDGKVWSLPWTVDVIMIAYNKRVLAEAGFANPPETWEEMLQYSEQLTKTDDAGMITQLGFRPSVGWTMAFTFGAELMNAERTEVTPDSQGFKDCLNWALEFYSKIPIEQVELAASGWGGWSTAEDPLVKGQLAMRQDGEYLLGYIERNAPAGLEEIGVAPLPYPAGKVQLKGTSETVAASLYIPRGG